MSNTKEIAIVYESETCLVINKPAGIVVNRSHTTPTNTIQDWMEEKYPELFESKLGDYDPELVAVFRERSGLAHRLDKDTSGALVLAKNPDTLADLMKQFKDRTVEKGYLALVHGQMNPRLGTIRVPLGRLKSDRRKFAVVVDGKMTETRYQVVELFEADKVYGDGFNLVALVPKTGRTHQLRVVLKHLGHTIAGDHYYLSKKRAKQDAVWCQRHFLHAQRICLQVDGQRRCFEVDLAADLQEALSKVRTQSYGI